MEGQCSASHGEPVLEKYPHSIAHKRKVQTNDPWYKNIYISSGHSGTRSEGQNISLHVHTASSFQKPRHAGGRCSKALTQILAQTVSRELDFSLELKSAVHKGFLRANAEFLRKAERFCANDGTTIM